jgi:hypothetical protein
MNKYQRAVIILGILAILIVLFTAPYYVQRDSGRRFHVSRSSSFYSQAQMDIPRTLLRIAVVCLIAGGAIWYFRKETII